MLAVQRLEARGNARHAAGGDPDGVVDELGTEEHVELQQLDLAALGAEARDGDEAVEVARAAGRGVEDDRVAAAEEARHDGFGHAGGETGRNGGVGGRATLAEDLEPCLERRGVSGGDCGAH